MSMGAVCATVVYRIKDGQLSNVKERTVSSEQFSTFIAAAVQATSAFLDLDAGLDKADRLIAEAAAQGAELIVFPEAWLPTYPYWPPTLEGPDAAAIFDCYAELWANAVEVPGPATERLGAAARAAGAVVVMGVNEREPGHGTLYNTLLYFGPDGKLIGKHRKLVPTYIERCFWGQGDGSTLGVVPTPLGRLGGLICFEHAMPLARYALIAQGEQVHVAAWPGYGGGLTNIMDFSLRHHAFEAQAFVVSACGYLDRNAVPAEFPLCSHLPDGVEGGSQIINPQGEVIAGPLLGAEGILTAEIDLRAVIKAKAWLDGAGHYARAEVLQLTINPQSVQAWRGTAVEEVMPLVPIIR
jgi:nitrilase